MVARKMKRGEKAPVALLAATSETLKDVERRYSASFCGTQLKMAQQDTLSNAAPRKSMCTGELKS
jgi:hypothetical protein